MVNADKDKRAALVVSDSVIKSEEGHNRTLAVHLSAQDSAHWNIMEDDKYTKFLTTMRQAKKAIEDLHSVAIEIERKKNQAEGTSSETTSQMDLGEEGEETKGR